MHILICSVAVLFLTPIIHAQQIWDVWSTTWDRSKLLTYNGLSSPINFGAPNVIGSADINVDDRQTYQTVWGFGGTLTDSAALVLSQLKTKNSNNYWQLLSTVFNSTDAAKSGGLNYLRVALGASDFSASVYSFDDTAGDTSLSRFDINRAPSYLFQTIRDIQSINALIRVHLLPWSPPGWMKDSGTMNGGSFQSTYIDTYARYLLRCLQGFQSKGITAYAIGIQNEPQNSNPTYPTAKFTYTQEGQVATTLRTLMNANGFGGTVIVGFEHNWDGATSYASNLINSYGSAFYGGFHCYGGSVKSQDTFHAAYPDKQIYFTECTGTVGSDWWSDIKWYMDNLFIGAIERNSHSGLMWNIAVRSDGEPRLPGTSSCGGGCRGIITVNTDGTYSLNQEYYAMAQASKAILPRDKGGPWGKRAGVTVGGSQSWALRVSAFVTGRTNMADWEKWSIVVLNWNDNSGGSWNPTPVQTTIEFRGKQATYTFPVGVTTLWWYAEPRANLKKGNTTFDDKLYVQGNHQVPLGV